MTIRLVPPAFYINRVDVRAKLPAEVWKAIAQAEVGDDAITSVLVADGDCNVWLFSPRKYDLLMERIRGLEVQVAELTGDAA